MFSLIISIVLSLSPVQSDEWDHITKASSLQKQGKFKEAIREYKKAVERNSDLAYLYDIIGDIYRDNLNDDNKAIENYLIGLKIDPGNYSLNLSIMNIYFEQDNISNGIKYYETLSALKKEKKYFTFPRHVVNTIFKDMSLKDRIVFCKKYLTMNPTDMILREVLSDIYMKKRDYANAKIEYEAMLQYGDESGQIYFGMGICKYYLGHYKDARNYLLKAKQLGEDVPQEYFDMVNAKIKEHP